MLRAPLPAFGLAFGLSRLANLPFDLRVLYYNGSPWLRIGPARGERRATDCVLYQLERHLVWREETHGAPAPIRFGN